VIQPHVPVRLPCYDLAPVTHPTLVPEKFRSFRYYGLPWLDGRCVQDPGTYSPRHADPRLLAIPSSRRRIAAYDPNHACFYEISVFLRSSKTHCNGHCRTCVALGIKAMMT